MRRKIYDFFLSWKNSTHKDCLIIHGARQIEKTYIIREFGNNEYESFIEINFLENPSLKVIFKGDLTVDEIYKRLTANIPNISLIPGKTLIFLDEIQKCANAPTAIKFLVEDGKYDIIASGSLLGLSYEKDADIEVEQVDKKLSIPHYLAMFIEQNAF